MNAEKTGKLIHDLRIKSGMTQQGLAEALNVSPTAISKWENGHSLPDISMLEPLAAVLNISISEIVIGKIALEQGMNNIENQQVSTNDTSDIAVKSVIEESIIQRRKSNFTITKIIAAVFAVIIFIILTIKILNANFDILIECCLIFFCLVVIAVCSVLQLIRWEVNKQSKISRKVMIIAVPVIAIVLLTALLANHLFPKARPINMPFASEITSVTISGEHGTPEIEVADADVERICALISAAKPTRIHSYDDNPAARPYYKIEVQTSVQYYCYFIYKEGPTVYFEIPYEGIYESNDQALEYVIDCYRR